MGSVMQISIHHKYKCCLTENMEEVETDEEDNNRQIFNQMPVLETDVVSEKVLLPRYHVFLKNN